MLSLSRCVYHVFLLNGGTNGCVFFKRTRTLHQIVNSYIFIFLKLFLIVFIFIFFILHFEKSFENLMIFIKGFFLFLRLYVDQKLLLLLFQFFLLLFSIILYPPIVEGLKLELSFFGIFKVHERVLENDLLDIRVVSIAFSLYFIKVFILLNMLVYLTLLADLSQFHYKVSHVVKESCFKFFCYVTEIFLL